MIPLWCFVIFGAWQIMFPAINISFFTQSPLPLWIPHNFHLTNSIHVHAYTSIIVSNESRIDLHPHLTSTLPEGHKLWLDACRHAAHMVCACNVYILWDLYSCERGTPAESLNMPGQVCGWEISWLQPAFKVNLKCTRERTRLTEKDQKRVWRLHWNRLGNGH